MRRKKRLKKKCKRVSFDCLLIYLELEEEAEVNKEEFVNPLDEPILFEIEERLKCELTKDGDVKKLEAKGEAFLTVFNPQVRKSELQLKIPGNNKIQVCNIDKKLFMDKKIIAPDVSTRVFYDLGWERWLST